LRPSRPGWIRFLSTNTRAWWTPPDHRPLPVLRLLQSCTRITSTGIEAAP